MYLVARNSILLHANNKGADQPAHPRSQLALESTLHAKNENKKFYHQTCVCGSRQLQRGGMGGGGGGGGIASRWKFVPVFLLGNT